MIYTNYHSSIVSYDAVRPKYILGTVMTILRERRLVADRAIDGI